MKTEILATYTNVEDGTTSIVFRSQHKDGGFGVNLRDDDSGEWLSPIYGFKTIESAMAKAQEVHLPTCNITFTV